MADYIGLPQITLTAANDTTGRNTGNYTCAFTDSVLPTVSQFEIYHMTIANAPILGTAQILVRNSLFSNVTALLNGGNEWDPSQPAIVNSGDEVDFLWAVAVTVTPAPQATLWLRYDAMLARNQGWSP